MIENRVGKFLLSYFLNVSPALELLNIKVNEATGTVSGIPYQPVKPRHLVRFLSNFVNMSA